MIREFQESDRNRCAEVYERAWNGVNDSAAQRSIPPEELAAETEGERIFVAEQDGEVRGFASLWEPGSFLHHLHVEPTYQRQGIGAALLDHVAGFATSALSLKCQTENVGALCFYSQVGFMAPGERGEDKLGAWVRLSRLE